MKIVTHNGKFHADEVFAVATLLLIHEGNNVEVVRTRDTEIIDTGDIVVDVGGKYDPAKGRFDHHQKEGAGVRENGIPYSSFGIVWKEYGERLCDSKSVSTSIDKFLVEPMDAIDNGVNIRKFIMEDVSDYDIGDVINAFNPSWKEVTDRGTSFMEAVEVAKKILMREIVRTKDKEEGNATVEKVYINSNDKRIIVLENYLPWADVLRNYPEPLFVVYQNSDKSGWHVQTVRSDPHLFESRKNLPKAWGGKRDVELQETTGVSDATFCHKNLFLCVAKTKEGAIALAEKALNA